MATQAFRNIIRPMDDVVTMMGFTASRLPGGGLERGGVAGKRYAMPLSFVAMTMYWNKDLLTAAGLTAPPTNADEFAKAAAAMTANGNHGFQITSGFPVQQIFQSCCTSTAAPSSAPTARRRPGTATRASRR